MLKQKDKNLQTSTIYFLYCVILQSVIRSDVYEGQGIQDWTK